MDKITTILLVLVVFLIIVWFSTFNMFNDSSVLSFNNENKDLSLSNNNATIKLLGGTTLSKNEELRVQLVDSNNQPIVNKPVSCRFYNDSSYGNTYQSFTDANGFASFNLDYVNHGFYNIELEYKSYDDNVGSCIIQSSIEVRGY